MGWEPGKAWTSANLTSTGMKTGEPGRRIGLVKAEVKRGTVNQELAAVFGPPRLAVLPLRLPNFGTRRRLSLSPLLTSIIIFSPRK